MPVEDMVVCFGHCHLNLKLFFVAFTVTEVAVETKPVVSYHDILICLSIQTCLSKSCSFYLIKSILLQHIRNNIKQANLLYYP